MNVFAFHPAPSSKNKGFAWLGTLFSSLKIGFENKTGTNEAAMCKKY